MGRGHLGWGLLVGLIVLRAVLISQQPFTPASGDPVGLLAQGNRGGSDEVQLQGRLLADPRPSPDGDHCRAQIQWPVGRSELIFSPCPQPTLQQGWHLQVRGRLLRPGPAPHPLLSGVAERLQRQHVATQLRVQEWTLLRRPPTPVADLRRLLAQRLMQAAGPERGGVLAALVLGSAVVPLPADLREAFRSAGLSHALAASGFHLSVLLGAVLPLARPLPRLPRLLLACSAMGLFLLLAGPQPSVLRAVLMAAIALAALESGRRGRPGAILAVSVVVLLLLRPRWLAALGFQFSVVATAALVFSAGTLQQGWQQHLPSWCRSWLAPALAVPLAACLWTLPLQLLHFGVVPSYALLVNLLAAPLLTPLTLGAMLLALVAVLLPPLLGLLLPPLAGLAGLLVLLVRSVAALPMAQWQLGRPAPLLVLLLALGLVGLLLPRRRRDQHRMAAALLAVACSMHLVALQADQLLLVHQGSRDLLVARHRGRSALVATHADAFSCHQGRKLAQGLGVQRFDWALLLDPLAPDPPQCWSSLAGFVLASADGSLPFRPGQRLESDGLRAEPLAMVSRGVQLTVGHRHWLLLPDRQDLWAWRDQRPGRWRFDGVWLGFAPRTHEQQWVERQGLPQVWISGETRHRWPSHWRASGASGSLQQVLG